MTNTERIQANNAELREAIEMAEKLPEAGTAVEVVLQSKTITPSKTAQEVTADEEYTALERVTVDPIPAEYIVPSGTVNITENGTHNVKAYESVSVDVPIPDGYIQPSGELKVTENGTHDVTAYASVEVNVEASGGDSTMEDGLVTGTLTEYKNNRVTTVGSYALANFSTLEKVVLPMAQTLQTYAFANDNALKHIDILGGGTLYGSLTTACVVSCYDLTTIIMRNENAVTKLQSLMFPFYAGQANITRNLTRSQWNTYGAVGRNENWDKLTTQVVGSITYFTGTVTDESSKPVWLFGRYLTTGTRLITLALAETEEEANALMLQYEEYFRNNGCRFYVPSTLVDSYKAATNWSIYADRIRAIEDYPDICGDKTTV